jgi:lipopolysaccharide/colanic/teichoic acid biosynthesis glycosyltransferase
MEGMVDVNDLVSAEIAGSEKPRTMGQFALAMLGRMRTQLVLGLLAALAAPAALFWGVRGLTLDQSDQLRNSLVGAFIAFAIGYLVFRKVTGFPGARAATNVLPAFVASYALVALVFFALRIDYNRLVILSSFVLTVAVLYGAFVLASRGARPRMSLAAVGDFTSVAKIPAIRWRLLREPTQARLIGPLVVDLQAVLSPAWETFIADCALEGRTVFSAKEVIESLTGRVLVRHVSENSFHTLTPNSIYAAAKRYLDTLIAALLLIALAPLMLALAFWIRLDSPGPALFAQERRGYRGRIFTCYKFRTMRLKSDDPGGSETESGADDDARDKAVTKDNDPRITRAGRILRKTRLDELPQLVNILLGEMSWIGPRPEAKVLSDWYEEEIPFYRYRHVVRPGITGWAQVCQGHVASLEDIQKKLEYDFYYAKHFSLWLDVLVAVRTIGIMLSGRGAK